MCLLFAAFLVTLYGYRIHSEYVTYKKIVVIVDARITDVDEVDDGDGRTDYKYWISYEDDQSEPIDECSNTVSWICDILYVK